MEYLLPLIKAVPITFTALFPVINPLGTAIIVLTMTEGLNPQVRRDLAKSIAINSVVLLTVILLGGSYILAFFGVSVPVIQAAGGVVLAVMGWKMLNAPDGPEPETAPDAVSKSAKDVAAKSFYPFTFPITVGPGCIAVIFTLSAHTVHETLIDTALGQFGAFLGILGNAVVLYFCIAYASRIAKRLGPSGTTVLMRLIAFLVVCIGAQISWSGIVSLISQLPPHH